MVMEPNDSRDAAADRSAELRTDSYDYHLPPELIAQEPAEPRDAARLMHVRRNTGTFRHATVRDLPELLRPGDLLVVNDSRVIPARVLARKPSGGRVELLFTEPAGDADWWALVRPARRVRPGLELLVDGGRMSLRIEAVEEGRARVRFPADADPLAFLERCGLPPLPPYIRRDYPLDRRLEKDRGRYQTVYARIPGSVAAPTAGLHFTAELLQRIRERGVDITSITLHVGPGTFRPVKAPDLRHHHMHPERYYIAQESAQRITRALRQGRRIVCVGTTVVRALESSVDEHGGIRAGEHRTDLFIHPPFRFRVAGALLTNFHLPRSTLLMLVCAFAGRDLILRCYRAAVAEKYRFYSYGDCMFIE